MSKRERPVEEDERPQKRPRQDAHQPAEVQEILFARQLQDFLIFRQDGYHQLRNGIASFKAFLESIFYHKEEDNRGRQISILREYLETQKPADAKDLDKPFLSQLWQAWSFANQNNNDYLASSISSILALLLRTLASILDLREHGLLLCRTVLQHQHLRLIKRCLDAPKHKDFVISPCLRLLTEVAAFDGGVVARELYKRREQTFDSSVIRRCLGLIKTDIDEAEARRKPAIRTLTLRYVCSLLKYLHEGGKTDILKSRPLCGALFQNIRHDPAEVVIDFLGAIEQSILKDSDLPRSAKTALLTSQNLERVTEIATRDPEEFVAANKAFDWLKAICSKPDYGILRPSGWYPPGSTDPEDVKGPDTINLGLESLQFYDRHAPVNIRNPIMLAWAQTLRAHTSERERELLITCFTAAPELVAAYFREATTQLDPKLSNTWIGYASLFFEIVALPVPNHFSGDGHFASLPPQTTIVIENILPRPLTRAVLTRCLNLDIKLITFFAVQILVLAFQKLAAVLRQMRACSIDVTRSLWREAEEKLMQQYLERCPAIKDVIAAFRKLPDNEEHALQREATTRLLRLFYEITPASALDEQFNISVTLTAALTRSEESGDVAHPGLDKLRSLELEHLLTIAHHSSGTKWFNKQGALAYSPTITLLRIHRKEPRNEQLRLLSSHVLTECGILNAAQSSEEHSPMDALIASVLRLPSNSSAWGFIDDCIARGSRQPVKYVDDLDTISQVLKDSKKVITSSPSLLTAVIIEQASFVAAKPDANSQPKADWIELFLSLLQSTTDKGALLQRLHKDLSKLSGWKALKVKIDDDLSALLREVEQREQHQPEEAEIATEEHTVTTEVLPYQAPPDEPENHPELTRWSQKDFESAVEDGDIDALMLCLCSHHSDVRIQASAQLNKLKLQLRSTPSEENGAQISLLVGELLETFEQHRLHTDSPLSYIAGTFATRALRVLVQPQHFIYPKLNQFLIRGPEWRVSRLPAYWLSNTVLGLPEYDDAYWRETQWVLDWLIDGLRTQQDLDILRRGDIFEKAMALVSSPGAERHARIGESILELVFRATCVQGGSNMLITRTGILSWLEMMSRTDSTKSTAIRGRILEACEAERIEAWAGAGLEVKA